MVIYTSPIAGTSENYEGRIIVDESDYRLVLEYSCRQVSTESAISVDEKLPFETKGVVRIRVKEKFSKLYECFDVIGEGKFGKVYRCREKETGLELAAKRIKIKRDADRQQVEREVEIMTKMRHPRIAQIYDAFSTPENDIVLVMEVVPGGELFDRVVQENYILTELAVVMIICQLCEAVDYIHSKHIVHLDIKPENIMCVSQTSNRIKLIDFGLAQYYDGSSNLLFMAGTPEFVAPEVVKYEPLDFHTDMWSIGVITYILLSGISPFLGETLVETYCAVGKGEWEFDEECFEGISNEAKDFITKLLVYDQKQRMLPADCLQHPWIVQARARTACRSPVCAANEGKPISKESLRSYIKNQRFRRATWAVLFLMRFKRFGHISWPTLDGTINVSDFNGGGIKKLSQKDGILEELPCVIIENSVNIAKTDSNDGSGKPKMNIEIQETIARPNNLFEKQVQGIKLKAFTCNNMLFDQAMPSTITDKMQKTKAADQLSDYQKLSAELKLPIKQCSTASFQCSKRQIRVHLSKKPKVVRIRKSFVQKQRISVQQIVQLQKPIRKEFCFTAKTTSKCANIVIGKCAKEYASGYVHIQNRISKRPVKRASLLIQTKVKGKRAEVCDFNNNQNNSNISKDKSAIKPNHSLKELKEMNELQALEIKNSSSKPVAIIYNQVTLANKQKSDSMNAATFSAPDRTKVSKRVSVAERLYRVLGDAEISSKRKISNTKLKKIREDEALPMKSAPTHSDANQKAINSEEIKSLNLGKNSKNLRTPENSNNDEKAIKRKKTQVKKVEGTKVDSLSLEGKKHTSESSSSSERAKAVNTEKSCIKSVDTTLSTGKSETIGLSSTDKTEKTTAQATVLPQPTNFLDGIEEKADSNISKKTEKDVKSTQATAVEKCRKTFKIASIQQQQNSNESCQINLCDSTGNVRKYPQTLKLKVKEPHLKATTSCKKAGNRSSKSNVSSCLYAEKQALSTATEVKNSFTKKKDLNKQDKKFQLRQTQSSVEQITSKNMKIEKEGAPGCQSSSDKAKMHVAVGDNQQAKSGTNEDSVVKQSNTKSKTGTSLECLNKRLEQNLKIDDANKDLNDDRKRIEVSKAALNNAQNSLKMWKLTDKSNNSVAVFNSLKVV
uniref:Protein kinase domain-containing protein n=1 Tax=Syphacia muris TaxID=451379 RepID=A0A0N5AAL1_9BILA